MRKGAVTRFNRLVEVLEGRRKVPIAMLHAVIWPHSLIHTSSLDGRSKEDYAHEPARQKPTLTKQTLLVSFLVEC